MTIGGFIKLLEGLRPKQKETDLEPRGRYVRFDFGYAVATELDSYRGSYEELALGFDGRYSAEGLKTVGALLDHCRAAIGKTYVGWKGGDFLMREGSELHVANSGCTSDTEIIGVRDDGYFVDIVTHSPPPAPF